VNGTVKVQSVQTSPLPVRLKLKLRLWALVQATLFRWSPAALRVFRRWLLQLFGARLAPTASIHPTARIDCPWNLEMGHCASLGEETWVYSLDKVVLGEYACVGQRTMLLTGSHDFSDPTFPLVTRPVVIGYGCWIAVGVTVLPGVKIGALSVVGAGSVVTKDLPEQMVCAGNPCKPIKQRELPGDVTRARATASETQLPMDQAGRGGTPPYRPSAEAA
jgi:putative colanic acid biosynthesis acetyltransferase WcaF